MTYVPRPEQLQLIEPCVECGGPATDFYTSYGNSSVPIERWICAACDRTPRSYSEGITIARLMQQGMSYRSAMGQIRQENP